MTIHIDETSTLEGVRRAAEIVAEASGRAKEKAVVEFLVEQFREMVYGLHAPFEIRFDAPDSEPVVVIYPRTRELGEERKREAIAKGEWVDNDPVG